MPKITKLRLDLLKLFRKKPWLLFSGHDVYGCPENFWESLTMPTVTLPKKF